MSHEVLHVVPRLLDEHGRLAGGGERYPMELARHMARRVPVRLLSFGPSEVRTVFDGIPLRVIGGDWATRARENNPMSWSALAEVLQADVVHCHQREVMISKIVALWCRLAGTTSAVTDHGGGAWDWTSRLRMAELFDHHLHVSRFSMRTAGHEHRSNAAVVLGGVDTERFAPGRGSGQARRALFVGRLLPHKGVDDLIAGLPEGLGLDIVGRAVNSAYLNDLRALADGKDVRFHHDFDDRMLVETYRSALCLVLPSKYRDRYGGHTAVPELLGQTLLEGMACGRPAICTEVGGMPEIVVDGVTGYVVPENDPEAIGQRLSRLMQGPRLADTMGQAARDRVLSEFTWSRVVDRCLEAYADRTG